jgi:MFS family permease
MFSDIMLIFGQLILWSATDKHYLLFGRFFTGIGMGGNFVSSLTYLYESAPRKLRGSYLNFYFFFISFGLLLAYFVNQMITLNNWNVCISFGSIFPLVQIIVIGIWFDETPEYLYSLGEEMEAELNLK